MFMHIFRGCSGGNSRGKICSDVLHIDEFSWNTAPCLENCGELGPASAFIAFCENMRHLFWKARQVSAAFLLFKWGWWRQEARKGFLFSEGIKKKKEKHEARSNDDESNDDDDDVNGAPQFFRGPCWEFLAFRFPHHFSSCHFLTVGLCLCTSSSASNCILLFLSHCHIL